ncbi:MAG TPA: hypothetical protein VIK18_16100 [Pirellulales bacterium]
MKSARCASAQRATRGLRKKNARAEQKGVAKINKIRTNDSNEHLDADKFGSLARAATKQRAHRCSQKFVSESA